MDRQASDVVLLDLTGLETFTDYFVIASATNDRQLQALIDTLSRERKARELTTWHEEGPPSSGWVLIDLGDVVVHLFSEERRAYYDLEGLWRRAQEIVRIQ